LPTWAIVNLGIIEYAASLCFFVQGTFSMDKLGV